MTRPRIHHPDLLGICPVRELVRLVCPGADESEGPSLSTIDLDQLMRYREQGDWLGRIRLVEAQLGVGLAPVKAITYGLVDFAFRASPLAPYYDGAYVVSGYADVKRPDDLRDADAVRAWVRETFAGGAAVNGVRVTGRELVAWLRQEVELDPLAFEKERKNIERALRAA